MADDSLKLGLGLGLGLGIPLVAAVIVALWLLSQRRRKNRVAMDEGSQGEPLRDWKQQQSPISADTHPTPTEVYAHVAEGKQSELGGQDVTELPSEHMVFEAPRQHERVELEGDPLERSRSGKR
ncbi:hypothetical protein B0A50_05937 [Salinomyces thailandicus]|uniref:Uncharacterized protein n=1 Tax=Salinomyces thailandicus TaxID=706561 RepID=A0A4V5N3W2_9PEZI|nr:hypothetical protein B0A50_05937 [Salinomyces thailandica]